MGPMRTLLTQALEEEAELGAVLEKRGSPADAGGGGTLGRGPAAGRYLARLPEPCGPRDRRPLCLSAVSATFWVKKWWWKGDLETLHKQKAGGGWWGTGQGWGLQLPGDPREVPGVRFSQGPQGRPEGRAAETDVPLTEDADVGATQAGTPFSMPRTGHRLG